MCRCRRVPEMPKSKKDTVHNMKSVQSSLIIIIIIFYSPAQHKTIKDNNC